MICYVVLTLSNQTLSRGKKVLEFRDKESPMEKRQVIPVRVNPFSLEILVQSY